MSNLKLVISNDHIIASERKKGNEYLKYIHPDMFVLKKKDPIKQELATTFITNSNNLYREENFEEKYQWFKKFFTKYISETSEINKELEQISSELAEFKSVISSSEEEESIVEQITRIEERLNDVRETVGRIDERTKSFEKTFETLTRKIDTLPTKSDIMSIVADGLKDKPSTSEVAVLVTKSLNDNNIARQDFVESKINNMKSNIITWSIGIGIAAISATVGIIRLFL
ncbi:hypothetical protein PZE06_16265 [Robertmurraya sp. DFI.2.37]|uniref:hypothetical protein n=1 Tax=Robertmurraya sp. DFI.2.37 TaxID=3031819 RepID=UPI0012460D66|nr:hypothetical protein [Robertmurraya sp. DFI.2.37]MDF1509695.1 hypothetical protein [Robertmurraya sp. DFI.2.37]